MLIHRLHTFILFLVFMSIDITRFKNACKELLEASGHKVISAKAIGYEVHLQYKEAGTGDAYHVVFKPWV